MDDIRIALVAGPVSEYGWRGHHDYAAGIGVLGGLLEQTPGVSTLPVPGGWPQEASAFDDVRAAVFYTGGGGKQAFLATEGRRERMQSLLDRGMGLVLLHQAVSCRADHLARMQAWAGGAHLRDVSARGHWRTRHRSFPEHPVTRGVAPWAVRDGWLREIVFAQGATGITPLAWSSRRHRGASTGGSPDVVAWTYERPRGGRSFCFTGLHAHVGWSLPGVCQLVVNGVLWSAGLPIPLGGAAAKPEGIRIPLTPRKPPPSKLLRRFSSRRSAVKARPR
jgi:hypothetical protein